MKQIFYATIVFLTLSVAATAQSNRQDANDKRRNARPDATQNQQQQNQIEKKAENADAPEKDAVTDDEVVRIDTNLVTVPVTVYDRDGRFVPDLKRDDFTVFENDKQQELAFFAATDAPFTVALVLDASRSTAFQLRDIQNAAYLFVKNLRPADRVMIVSFDEETRFLSEPTNDREVLRQAINQTKFGGGTSLYEAVNLTLERMKKIPGRKAFVLFTDGVDTTSRLATARDTIYQAQEMDVLIYGVQYDTFDDVQRQMASGVPGIDPNRIPDAPVSLPQDKTPTIPGTNIPLPQIPQRRRQRDTYPPNQQPGNFPNDPSINRPDDPTTTGRRRDDRDVVVASGGTTSPEYRRAAEYLGNLTSNTGGRLFHASKDGGLTQAFDRVAEELRRQYSLGYYPAIEGKTGERRRIKVKVNRQKTSVRARDGYIVGKTK
jgi:Mg-chelatase subunit ChlD